MYIYICIRFFKPRALIGHLLCPPSGLYLLLQSNDFFVGYVLKISIGPAQSYASWTFVGLTERFMIYV